MIVEFTGKADFDDARFVLSHIHGHVPPGALIPMAAALAALRRRGEEAHQAKKLAMRHALGEDVGVPEFANRLEAGEAATVGVQHIEHSGRYYADYTQEIELAP